MMTAVALITITAICCWLGNRLASSLEAQADAPAADDPGWTALDDHQLERLLRQKSP